MRTKETFLLTAVTLALSLGVAGPSLASASMCKDKMAKSDTMGGDAMAKGDNMAAADAGMKKDDAMKDEPWPRAATCGG